MHEMILTVVQHYAKDPTVASITFSYVQGKGFYCSVIRYYAPRAGAKQVVCSAFGTTVENAMNETFTKWKEIAKNVEA